MFPRGPAQVLFIGTAVIDRMMEADWLPGTNGTTVVRTEQTTFGGRGAGPAATYGLLGGQAGLLAAVGSDFTSSGFEQFLKDSSVEVSLLSRSTSDRCCSTNTYIDAGTRATMCFFEPRQLDDGLSPAALSALATADALYVAGYYSHDGLALAADAARSGVPMALSLCNGIIPYVSDKLLRSLIASATLLAFNDEEWEIIKKRLGITQEEALFGMTETLECVYHTRGSQTGIGRLRGGRHFDIPVRMVSRCQSALGAGDTFMAGVLYGRLLQLNYVDCAIVGSLLASLKVEASPGATFPVSEDARVKDRLLGLIRESGLPA
ncbi:MAG TPA: PfkB family carbohydrate kinase [Streptosporangiaceae bacterium]|nr:PfkB family carbohydrate kinase [Streptosporangiaceae bacterium]